MTPSGVDYTGTVARTVSNRTCQRWDSNTPHEISSIYLARLTAREGNPENYCRNTDADEEPAVWCFTTDPAKRWEFCSVPMCDQC